MSAPRSVAEVLNEHVTLEVEGIDRMYLNVYVPGLQREQGVVNFFRFHRGNQFVSSALMDPISKEFVAALENYARRKKVPVIQFRKGQRKDDIAAERRKKFKRPRALSSSARLRPGQVHLIFDRRVTARTPGRFRTRVITDGVVPSLHVDYKNTRIKQYHKEGRALRTETTINNTRDFGIGKLLKNLPALRQIGFQANRRLLDVQRISHDCAIGEDAFDKVVRPAEVEGQRASALRFGDKRVQALFAVLVVFSLQLRGFNNREMRVLLAQLPGLDPAEYPIGRMTCDLRRLRLHGIIERIPRSHRYQLTADGLRIALFFSRTCARLLRPKLAEIMPRPEPIPSALRIAFDRPNAVIDACCEEEQLAA